MSDMSPIISEVTRFQVFGSVYMGVLAMGFFYGLTLCSFSCLPLIGPYIFATRSGFRQGFDSTAVFIAARVVGYTLFGALAGLAGNLVLAKIGTHGPAGLAGLLILAIGLGVMVKPRKPCAMSSQSSRRDRRSTRHMATLGLATSLMPCPPLYAVMLYAATTQSMWVGAAAGPDVWPRHHGLAALLPGRCRRLVVGPHRPKNRASI